MSLNWGAPPGAPTEPDYEIRTVTEIAVDVWRSLAVRWRGTHVTEPTPNVVDRAGEADDRPDPDRDSDERGAASITADLGGDARDPDGFEDVA